MSALLTVIAVTSTPFVKIPWAHIRVHVKLVIQEMEIHVMVRWEGLNVFQFGRLTFKFYSFLRLTVSVSIYFR